MVLHWVEQGVRIFRVDNPHTKPLPFWALADPRGAGPSTRTSIFLSEAFTRPKVMRRWPRSASRQSYTYFTWRNFKRRARGVPGGADPPPVGRVHARQPLAQHAGHPPRVAPAAAARRPSGCALALAATLSAVLGHLLRLRALRGAAGAAGQEEYLDSREVQLGALGPRTARATSGTASRRAQRASASEHRALQLYENLELLRVRTTTRCSSTASAPPDGDQPVLVAVSLDPFRTHRAAAATCRWRRCGLGGRRDVQVHELLTGERSCGAGARATVTPHARAAGGDLVRRSLPAAASSAFDYYF